MKGLLEHILDCPIKSQGACPKCRRVWLLLQHHAKNCSREGCSVPKCAEIREALRRRDEAAAEPAAAQEAAQAAQTDATLAAATTAADEKKAQKRAAEDMKDDDNEAFEEYAVDKAHCLFRDPYIASDGWTYEKNSIEEWVATQANRGLPLTSPKTNAVMEPRMLPNLVVQVMCREFLERMKKEWKETRSGGRKKC